MFDKVSLECRSTRYARLEKALLIYREGNHSIVTENPVEDGVIHAGKLLDLGDLKSLVGGLSGEGSIRAKTMIGDEYKVLGFTHDAVLFRVSGRERKLVWENKRGRKKAILVPDMLFRSSRSGLKVWVVMGPQIFEAPFYNVWQGGKVCLGSNKFPDIWDLKAWEELFFKSPFTYTNGQTVEGMSLDAYWTKSYKVGYMFPAPMKEVKTKVEDLL